MEPGVNEINPELKAGLKVTVTAKPGCRRILEIEVPASEVNREFEAAYKRLRQDLSVPGYRKGKAPLELLRARYAASAAQEVKESLVPQAYQQALKEKNLSPISMQEVSEIELKPDQPLKFRVEIEISPEIRELKYQGLEVEKPVFMISDKLIDKTVKELQESHAELEVIQRKARRGDVVAAEVEKVVSESAKPQRSEDIELLLEPDRIQKEFYEALIGKGSGEVVEVTLTNSADEQKQSRQGETVKYRLEVRKIKARRLPELNEEFARRFTGWTGRPDPQNIAELRANIEADLDLKARREAEKLLRENLIRKVVEANPVEMPESLVSDYTTSVSQGLKSRLENLEEEKFRESYRPHALDQLRWELLFHRIAEREKIEISEGDLEAWVRSYAERFQLPMEKVRQNLSDEKGRERIEEQLLENKVIDFLISKSEVREKGVPYDVE